MTRHKDIKDKERSEQNFFSEVELNLLFSYSFKLFYIFRPFNFYSLPYRLASPDWTRLTNPRIKN